MQEERVCLLPIIFEEFLSDITSVLAKSRFRTRFSGEDNSVLELLPSTSGAFSN
jgi:hypothetical protein